MTIQAPVEQAWPWLAQLGQDRGGFYSYEWLENLAGCEMEKRRPHPPGVSTASWARPSTCTRQADCG